jgi:hypothetical protein
MLWICNPIETSQSRIRKAAIAFCPRKAFELTIACNSTYHFPSMATPSQPVGQTISHYRVIEKLGGGADGLLLLAFHIRDETTFPLKD